MAGQPVVRVHQVVVAGAVAGLGLHHPVGEGTELGGQLLLGQSLVGAGVDVPDEDTGSELHGGREGAGRGAGEDLDLDVDLGEALRELHDVDVHPAGVAGAGLVEGRGVHAEHRHAAWSVAAVGGPAQSARLRVTTRLRVAAQGTEPCHVLGHAALHSAGRVRSTVERRNGPFPFPLCRTFSWGAGARADTPTPAPVLPAPKVGPWRDPSAPSPAAPRIRTGCAGWTGGSRARSGPSCGGRPIRWRWTSGTGRRRGRRSSCWGGCVPSGPMPRWSGWRSTRPGSPRQSRTGGTG